jgi:hypothetical protein
MSRLTQLVAVALVCCLAPAAWAQQPGQAGVTDSPMAPPNPMAPIAAMPGPQASPFISEDMAAEPMAEGRSRAVYFVGEALFLKLNQARDQAVVINENTQETLLGTSDLNFAMTGGMRAILGWNLNDRWAIEASYFGTNHWNDTAIVEGNNNLSLPGDVALATFDFFDADRMVVSYSGNLHSTEANAFRRLGDSHLWLMAGFRYVRLSEHFNIHSTDLDSGTSDYDIRAYNDLFGGQIGARWERQWKRLCFEVTGKAGICGNTARQYTFLGDFDNSFVLRNSETIAGYTSFVGELDFNLTCRLIGGLSARAGYNLLWLTNVARAADQLDFTNNLDSGTALVRGNAFLHGVNVGLEARW